MQVPQEILHADARAVLDDPEIAIVMELIGGIEPARPLSEAMKKGKHVVTANKALLAPRRRSSPLPRNWRSEDRS